MTGMLTKIISSFLSPITNSQSTVHAQMGLSSEFIKISKVCQAYQFSNFPTLRCLYSSTRIYSDRNLFDLECADNAVLLSDDAVILYVSLDLRKNSVSMSECVSWSWKCKSLEWLRVKDRMWEQICLTTWVVGFQLMVTNRTKGFFVYRNLDWYLSIRYPIDEGRISGYRPNSGFTLQQWGQF